MTPHKIEELVERWAQKATYARKTECVQEYQAYWRGYAEALDQCADEIARQALSKDGRSMDALELAARVEAYDPVQSPDNRGDELELHRDIVLLTGIGSMNPSFEMTFVRSLDAAMTLVPEGWYRHFSEIRGPQWMLSHPTCCAKGKAATPALALCAAALRAIAAQGGTHAE